MSQWVKVKSGYINLSLATDIEVRYSEGPGIEGVIQVSVFRLSEMLWSGQSERPDGYDFDPDGVMGVLAAAQDMFGERHEPVWIPTPD